MIWLSEEFEAGHVKRLISSRWLLYRYNGFLLMIPLHSVFLVFVCFTCLLFICWLYLCLIVLHGGVLTSAARILKTLHRGIIRQEELAPLLILSFWGPGDDGIEDCILLDESEVSYLQKFFPTDFLPLTLLWLWSIRIVAAQWCSVDRCLIFLRRMTIVTSWQWLWSNSQLPWGLRE